MQDQYWATLPVDEIAKAVAARWDTYQQWGQETGYFDRIDTSYRTFYGMDSEGTLRISRDDNDVAQINVNHFKSLIKRLHILVTENKLAFQPRARQSDAKSLIESDLAKGICAYYGDEKNLHHVLSTAVLGALISLEQYVHCPWDLSEGYELTTDGSRVIKSGDQRFEVYGAHDVAKNTAGESSSWHIVRCKVNKYDEAALTPEFADDIPRASLTTDTRDRRDYRQAQRVDDDQCYKFIMYHARTPAMPEGRHVEIIGEQVLVDKPLAYDRVPLFRLTAGDVIGTCFGDSPAIEMLPLQEALNSMFSGTLTNTLNNCVQMIWSSDPNLEIKRLTDGQTLVTSASPPSGLNLTASGGESYKMIDMLVSHQQLLSGVNSAARGNPESHLKSGTSIAVVIAAAIQYVSDLQKGYARLAGEVGSCLLSNIRLFATEEMTAYITGVSRQGAVRKFHARDLMDIDRVTVDLGSPLTSSFAGRSEMVAAWQQYNIIKDPKQIVSFLKTGELEHVSEDLFSDTLLIREENELIRKGIKPTILLTDNHAEHILGHRAPMSAADRDDPVVMAAFLAHVHEHIAEMRATPPDLAAVLTGQPLPQPAMPAMPATPQPQVNGAALPSVPPGTPPAMAAALEQSQQALPPQQEVL